jgi:hypothetical protein
MTKEDKALHKGLMKILGDGTFPLQARDVAVFSAVYRWANDLPNKIKAPLVKKKTKKKVVNKKATK